MSMQSSPGVFSGGYIFPTSNKVDRSFAENIEEEKKGQIRGMRSSTRRFEHRAPFDTHFLGFGGLSNCGGLLYNCVWS